MKQEAEVHAAEDQKRKEEIEARNTADNLVYQAEKLMREHGDKIPGELKDQVEGKMAAVRSALQGQDMDYVRSTVEELSQALQQVGAAVYQQAGPPPGEEGQPEAEPPPGGGPDEGTVEGEFHEV